MQVSTQSVRIRKRIRKDLGDIDGLAESMGRLGQLHPIMLTRNHVLLSGRRRLEAAKALGWKTIDATIVGWKDRARLLELELDENTQRAQLSPVEIGDALERLYRIRHPGFLRRLWYAVVDFLSSLFARRDE